MNGGKDLWLSDKGQGYNIVSVTLNPIQASNHHELNLILYSKIYNYGNPNVTKISKSITQLCNPIGILDNCKLNCAKVQRSWMLPTQLCKSAKVSILQTQLCKSTKVSILQTQLCKSTKVVDTANSTVQKYKGRAWCNLNCAILLDIC